MVLLGYKPDALAIAASNEKGAFAREFSEIAWRRLFWARALIGRIEHDVAPEDVSDAYKSYVLASEAWATRMMTFVTYTERFHGATKAAELEGSVVKAMNDLAERIVTLRGTSQDKSTKVADAHAAVDAANAACFHFVRGFAPK